MHRGTRYVRTFVPCLRSRSLILDHMFNSAKIDSPETIRPTQHFRGIITWNDTKKALENQFFIEKQNTTSNLWNYIDNTFSFDNTNINVHKIIGENVTAVRLLQIGLTATSLWPTLSQIHNMCGCLQTQLQCVLLHGTEQSLHTSFMVTHASEAYVHTHTHVGYIGTQTHTTVSMQWYQERNYCWT